MLQEITIDNRYAITDKGTSDGTQIKYFKDNYWYKIDRYGGEGEAEALASVILKLCAYPSKKYVTYHQIIINGRPGCMSRNFMRRNEQFVSLYRLYRNVTGRDLASVTQMMDYDDAIEFVLDFVLTHTAVDLRAYLADIFALDELILNDDRHFNNLGLIYNGTKFRPAPIFDNGKSLFIGNKKYDPDKDIKENKKKAFAKAFSGSFELNRSYLENKATFKPDIKAIQNYLSKKNLDEDNIYSRLAKLIAE